MARQIAHNHQNGRDQQGNLQGRAHRNLHRQIHLVFHSEDHRREVLSSVAYQGYQDDAHEEFRKPQGLGGLLEAPYQKLGHHRHPHRAC